MVADSLGARLMAAEPVGWGDARATHRLSLSDGRSVAVRRLRGSGAHARAERIAGLMARLAEAGLPVPPPTIIETAGGPWLVTTWVAGDTGASWLDTPDRARQLGDRMGRLARRLRTVAVDDGRLERRAGNPDDLDARRLDPLVFVHGDFAPVNVVVDPDGEIAALLDFEHAGTGPPLLDVAWWGWVVRHHHPGAWTAAWPAFLEAAGLEPGQTEAELHELVLRTLAQRADEAGDAEARRRWLDRLAVARRRTVAGGQAT
jgi:aminoglycoside phosphotransferase (APT) family kinase protein